MEQHPVKTKQCRPPFIRYFLLFVTWFILSPQAYALGPHELAVIINESDDLSIQIGEYYARQRNIPQENVIRIKFPPGKTIMTKKEFAVIKQ